MAHFQEVFNAIKPDSQFLAPGPRAVWLCGPWPYGADRKGLSKVFREWKWEARALQPTKNVEGGMMWSVQAVSDPPETVYALPHGQVVISRQPPAQGAVQASPAVIGQPATVKLCSTSGTDPWLLQDPWKPVSSTGSSVSTHSAPALAELEERIEASILSKMPKQRFEAMEVDDTQDRLAALETQLQQVTTRQVNLEGTVREHQAHSNAQIQNLQGQMMAQLDSQSKQMQSMLQDQMSRIETILSKKSRHE